MRLSFVLAGLSWLLSPVGSVPSSMAPTNARQEMILFGGDRKYTAWIAQTEFKGDMTIAILHTIANAHFNWVKLRQLQKLGMVRFW
jgi:hypothetical protein